MRVGRGRALTLWLALFGLGCEGLRVCLQVSGAKVLKRGNVGSEPWR